MEFITKLKEWGSSITELGVILIALAVILQILFGSATTPFLGVDVISNITNVVAQLGSQGLVGLVAIGVIACIFTRKN